jgi:hypothetical protein
MGISKTTSFVDNKELDLIAFPPNLGSTGDEPYMLIKIFETVVGNYQSSDPYDATMRTGLSGATGFVTTGNGAAIAAAINGRGTVEIAAAGFAGSQLGQAFGNQLLNSAAGTEGQDYVSDAKNSITNYSTKRNEGYLTTVIGLFMPESLHSAYNQTFDALSKTESFGVFGFLSQALGGKSIGNAVNPYLVEGVSKYLARLTNMNDNSQKILTYGGTGMTINPQLELLYSSPVLREFKLDFKFYPKSPEEAAILFGSQPEAGVDALSPAGIISRLGIIGGLKYYSAPQVPKAPDPQKPGTAAEVQYGGRFYIPPAQFQLEFYNKNSRNTKLFKTKNCVLQGIDIDYAPNGFATHDDGVPVEVRVQLTFKETVMLNREDINDGY